MKDTKMNLLGFVLILFFMTNSMNLYGKTYEIFSPNENIKVKIQVEDKISYSVFYNSNELITSSSMSMKIDRGKILGENPQIKDTEEKSIKKNIYPVIRDKREVIVDNYSERILNFRGKYGLIFRVYDDGVAYRFFTKMKGKVKIISEEATFNFTENHYVYFPIEESFITHSERLYDYLPLSEITAEKMSCLPVLIDDKDGPKIAITEADLIDYPGMYLTGSEDKMQSLYGKFPAYPLQKEQKGDRTEIVTKRADYIALTKGNRTFPWRVIVIAEKDGDLIESDIVYRLAKPLQLKNTAWIRPGKVAWDWWNANNIYGVDFKSGINTETYKYYIDFASQYNIEYIIMDEGWSNTTDLFDINPDINMEELLEYAEKKKVGIILWVVWLTLDNQLHEALDMFEKWGVKGIKVDFMQRDDQEMVNYYHKIAKEAAKRHLIIDFHGAFKPTGLRRAYPNVLTREGVKGLEQDKWCDDVTPEYDLTIPFIRMLAGPMDYTPGAMNNAQKKNFRPIFERPMSQGTRVHQLAMYIIYESPLQMLADSPSNYMREPVIVKFLSQVPTVWDETKVLDARVSDYVIVARKNGNEWYVGAMTDWTPRKLKIDFSFLEEGNYIAEIFSDGVNTARFASDFKRTVKNITPSESIQIVLAPGGGWVARIYKSKK